MNWSISRYIQWLDEHPNMNDRLTLIKYVQFFFDIYFFLNLFCDFRGTLETYVQTVRNRQQKEFAPIYIIILNILEKGLASTT